MGTADHLTLLRLFNLGYKATLAIKKLMGSFDLDKSCTFLNYLIQGCGQSFSEKYFSQHMKRHLPGICPFPDCKMEFKSQNYIITHVRT